MTITHTGIHPQAIVEEGAILGDHVTIEPFAIVKSGVKLGNHVVVMSHAYIAGNTTIGDGTVIYPGACIGIKTQARAFAGENTYVTIGANCEIREYVTINASFDEGSTVSIGDRCLIMAYCHIAHHCSVGREVTMANGVMLSGHVEVGNYAVLGGMTPIHQWVRIGAYAMVGGFSRVTHDIPPYTLGGGDPYRLGGLNLVGLKRRGVPLEVRQDLTKAFKTTYREGLPLADALDKLAQERGTSAAVREWIDFAKGSRRGLICIAKSEQEEGATKDSLEQ